MRRFFALLVLVLLSLVMTGLGQGSQGKILFTSRRDGAYDLFVVNPDGSGMVRLTNDKAGEITPAWSPDGTRIAFAHPELYIINADGSGLTKLGQDGVIAFYPAWSPDGMKLVYAASVKNSFQLMLVNSDGSGLVQLTDDGADNLSPIWSPDGATIYYFANYKNDIIGVKTGTYAIGIDGGSPRKIANGRLSAISPDGTRLIYVKGSYTSVPREGNLFYEATKTTYKAYLIGIDGDGRPESLGSIDGVKAIGWSPNGDRLAYLQNGHLYLVGGDGRGKKTRLASKVSAFSWSPDGRKIVCQSQGAQGRSGIALLGARSALSLLDPVDGSMTQLTEGPEDTGPLWSPK